MTKLSATSVRFTVISHIRTVISSLSSSSSDQLEHSILLELRNYTFRDLPVQGLELYVSVRRFVAAHEPEVRFSLTLFVEHRALRRIVVTSALTIAPYYILFVSSQYLALPKP